MIEQEPPDEGQEEGEPSEALQSTDDESQEHDIPPEAVNLVEKYSAKPEWAEWLETQAKKICKRIESDNDSRSDWLQARAEEVELFGGAMKKSATGVYMPHDPVGTRVILQGWTRGWDQIVPAKGTLLQVLPNGPEDEESAAKREKHMNWQLRHKVPNWAMGIGESYLQFWMSGSVFREKSWNPVTRTTEFEHLTADDVIVAFSRKDSDPLMKKVPRVTRVLHLYRWDIEEFADSGMFFKDNVEKIYSGDTKSASALEPSVVMDAGGKIDGVEAPGDALNAPDDKEMSQRDIYRCHTWMKLPDQDRMKPVIFTIDQGSKIPLALTLREDDDPFDQMRFQAQTQEWEIAAKNVQASYQAALQRHQAMTAQGIPAQEPKPPQMPKPPAPVKQKTLYSMIHYRMFPNPAGFYGLGVGYLLKNANLLINKLEGEYLQSARMANIKSGFLAKGAMGPKGGAVEVETGKWIQTELEPEQMGGIKEFQFSPPSDGLWRFIKLAKENCETLVADVSTMSGEAGPTNETKAAAQMRMANATQLVGVIARLFMDPLAEEVKLLAHDNRNFLGDSEFYYVTEPSHTAPNGMQTSREQISKEDYKDEFSFTFTADQRLQTQNDRVQTVSGLITQLAQIPLMQDPARGPQIWYTAMKKLFQALDMPEFTRALGEPPPPPQPPQPPAPMDQVDETAGFFNGQDHPVLPDDDDEDHLVKLDDFKNSQYAQQMPPTGKQLLDRHEAAHWSQLYKKQAAQHAQQGNGLGMGGGQGMVTGPGDGGLPPNAGAPPAGGPSVPAQPMPGGPPQ